MTSRTLAAFPPPPWAAVPAENRRSFWARLLLVICGFLLAAAAAGLIWLAGYQVHRGHLWQDTLATVGFGEPVPGATADVDCSYKPGGRRSQGYYTCHARLALPGGETVAAWDFDAAWGLYDDPAEWGRGVRRLAWSPDGYAMATTARGLFDRLWEAVAGPLFMVAFCALPLVVIRLLRRSRLRLEEAAAAGRLVEVDLLKRTRHQTKSGQAVWRWDVAYDDAAGRRRYHAEYYAEGALPLTTDWASSRGLALMGERKVQALLTDRLWPLALEPEAYTRVVAAAALDREADHGSRRMAHDAYRDWTKEAPSFAAQLDKAVALGEAGDGDACYTVGWLTFHGEGVPKDTAVAARWFERGALADDPRAQHNLAHMLHHGDGVVRDDALAVFWAQVAAMRYATPEDGQNALALRANAAADLSPRELDAIIGDARDWRPGMPPLASRG